MLHNYRLCKSGIQKPRLLAIVVIIGVRATLEYMEHELMPISIAANTNRSQLDQILLINFIGVLFYIMKEL